MHSPATESSAPAPAPPAAAADAVAVAMSVTVAVAAPAETGGERASQKKSARPKLNPRKVDGALTSLGSVRLGSSGGESRAGGRSSVRHGQRRGDGDGLGHLSGRRRSERGVVAGRRRRWEFGRVSGGGRGRWSRSSSVVPGPVLGGRRRRRGRVRRETGIGRRAHGGRRGRRSW